MTARRPDGLTAAIVVSLVLLAVRPSGRLAAQDSQFGIQGLGTPGKQESVRARSTGGAFAPFDPFSPLMDAGLADVRRLSAGITNGTSWRGVPGPPPDSSETTLRTTRFPALVLAGPILSRLTLGGGFATYLDRSYGITIQDTIDIRGNPEAFNDEIKSDGGVTDVRLAAGIRVTRRLAIGGGLHLLTGSSRIVATRRFEDSSYQTSSFRDEVAYEGLGASFSALLDFGRDLRLAGWLRSDSKLRSDLNGRTVAENDLPISYGGGFLWAPGGQVVLAGTAAWHGWSSAGPSANAHDTFNWSFGAEIGSANSPFRIGARGGQMPFGIDGAPTEIGLSAGIGRGFAAGRGRLDVGVERLERKGTGLTERVWTLLLGVTVRP